MHARLLYKIELQKSRQRKYCCANRLIINVTVHGRRVVVGGRLLDALNTPKVFALLYFANIKKNLFSETIILFFKQFQVNFLRKDYFPIVVK